MEAPEFDEKEDVSFEDKFSSFKVILSSVLVLFIAWKGHNRMELYRAERQARIDGNLDLFLEEQLEIRKKSRVKNFLFGKINDADLKKDKLGGDWLLEDLEGKPFGSKSLLGNYYLLFFGGSLCPDVCPMTLHRMSKALRLLDRTGEGKQYMKPDIVFVATNPEYDSSDKLYKWGNMFGPPYPHLLRAKSATDPNFLNMLSQFKVPVGVNPEEVASTRQFFQDENKGFLSYFSWMWKPRTKSLDDAAEGYLNDHSRVIYLIAPDNKFLAFYSLDLSEKELALQITEDISYDIGTMHIGTGRKPQVYNSPNK